MGTYRYESSWNGAYPSQDSQTGVASGVLTENFDGIEARFEFVAFNASSILEIHQSAGKIVIGESSNPEVEDGLTCSLN